MELNPSLPGSRSGLSGFVSRSLASALADLIANQPQVCLFRRSQRHMFARLGAVVLDNIDIALPTSCRSRRRRFHICSSDVAIGEDSKPFVTWLLDLQRREGHRFRAAAEARGRSSEEPVAKPNAAAARRTLMLAMKSHRMRQYSPITCARSAAPRRTRRRSRASLPRNISTSHRGVSTTFQSCRRVAMGAPSVARRMSSGEC